MLCCSKCGKFFIKLFDSLGISLIQIVNLKCPQLLFSPVLPWHFLARIRYDILSDQLFHRLVDSRTDTFLEILAFSAPGNNLRELKPTERVIVIFFKVFFFEICGDEDAVDILRSQIFVDYFPVAACIHEIEPINDRVRFGVCNLTHKLILEMAVISSKNIKCFHSIAVVFDKLVDLRKLHISRVTLANYLFSVVLPFCKDTNWLVKMSDFFDLSHHLLYRSVCVDRQMLLSWNCLISLIIYSVDQRVFNCKVYGA